MQITVQIPVEETPRVLQVRGLFDLPHQPISRRQWEVDLPLSERGWQIGLIVGPSGSGKSTIARALFPQSLALQANFPPWPERQSILDAFPTHLPVKQLVGLLAGMGLSSPPAWLRPFGVLSTGEQFRAGLARLLAEGADPVVVDEYTSAVDRTTARSASAAVARTVRSQGRRLVAVTCHEDIEDWLQPDWVYRPAENAFTWRCLRRRPAITLAIQRVHRRAWQLFCSHHYLSGALAPAAVCFVAAWEDRPAAFSAWIQALSRRAGKREHRTVCLPECQGLGIGHALSSFCASLWKALGYRATSTTSHPAFVAARSRAPDWRLIRPPRLAHASGRLRRLRHARTRLTAGFEYIGPALDRRQVEALCGRNGPGRRHF